MKFTKPQPKKYRSFSIKSLWSSWYIQLAVYLLAFVLGAALYRSGHISTLIRVTREVFVGNTSSIVLPESIANPVEEAVENISNEVRLYIDNDLQTLYIDIGFEEYQQILAKRNEAVDLGILLSSDDDYVPAAIHVQDGDTFDVKMRLKGDWTDHLEGDKWSFRIKIKDEGALFGTQEFNIQTPETRNYIWEWAFHQNLIDEGVLTTRYDFSNVVLNGQLLGVYAVEDAFTTELMESQKRREGILLRFDEDILWDTRADFWSIDSEMNASIQRSIVYESAILSTFKSSKITRNPVLEAEAETAMNKLAAYQRGELPASEVFDVQLLGRFLAMSDLWDAAHGLFWQNIRFYYNPVSSLLEPVAYDNAPFSGKSQGSIISRIVEESIFEDPKIRAAYAAELERITAPDYINQLKVDLEEDVNRYQKALKVEYNDANLGVDWALLETRANVLRQELYPSHPVRANYQLVNETGQQTLVLDITNLMLLPIELTAINIDGQEIRFDAAWNIPMVEEPDYAGYAPVQIEVPLDDVFLEEETQVEIMVRLKGLTQETTVGALGQNTPVAQKVGPMPSLPSLDEALLKYGYLTQPNAEKNTLLIKQGSWLVNGDLVLPDGYDLIIPPGTTLSFEPGAIMLMNGALQIKGSETSPVLITAKEDALGWGGLVVLNAENRSIWEYALVEGTTGIEREGWILTGGITFYQSDITLDHVWLGNNQTEDTINVIHSDFNFMNSEFAYTFSDAFDSDFSTGEITNCIFHDVNGDGIDVSGTPLIVKDTQLFAIVDKAVSVGENSQVRLQNVSITDVGIGVASKDLSSVIIEGSEINNASFAALAAYIKKPVYGPASIEAAEILLNNNYQDAIVQTGSKILLWGEAVDTVDMNVDLLYDQQILGN